MSETKEKQKRINVTEAIKPKLSDKGADYLRRTRGRGFSKSALALKHNLKLAQIADKLATAKQTVIAIHERPDGDAVSSALALRNGLRQKGKSVAILAPDPVPEMFNFLSDVGRVQTGRDSLAVSEGDLLVLLDAHSLSRVGLSDDAAGRAEVLVIDHHPEQDELLSGGTTTDGRREAAASARLIEPSASSTSELIYLLLEKMGTEINKDIATAVLTGLVTDTGRFQHNNTTPASLEIAAEVIARGAQLNKVIRHTYQNMNLRLLRLWGVALSRLRRSGRTNGVVSFITRGDVERAGLSFDDDLVLSGLASIINQVPDSKFALLLAETGENEIKGSLRSDPFKRTDVSKIASLFGGGGHPLSSGFKIKGKIVREGDKWRIS